MTNRQPTLHYRVSALLRMGLGVEDIALLLGVDVSAVRGVVASLRASGDLARIYGGIDLSESQP